MKKKTNIAAFSERRKSAEMVLNRFHTLSALVSRAELATRLGLSYGDNRDLYQALGYKQDLTYTDYYCQYIRQDIAKAAINRPVEATWSGDFSLMESDKTNDTALEIAFADMYKKLKLKSTFMRLDKLACLGKYAALFMGFSDVKSSQDLANPVSKGSMLKLMYMKPLGEGSAKIATWENNTASERYGRPTSYDITIKEPGTDTGTSVRVHFTRILHVTGELLESDIDGVPYLECIFNRLKDLEKLAGGSGEMFWRGARPGYAAKADEEHIIDDELKADLEEQFDEFEHNLRRVLAVEGMDLNTLAQQVADPKNHIDIQLSLISAATGIPKRILTGSELGELASTQDRDNWHEFVSNRRKEYAQSQIVCPFVDTMIDYGCLPAPTDDYEVAWPDLFSLSEESKVNMGNTRSTALKTYADGGEGTQSIIPPETFLREFLGFDEDSIELILKEREEFLKELEKMLLEEEEKRKEEELNNPPEPPDPNTPPDPNAPPPAEEEGDDDEEEPE